MRKVKGKINKNGVLEIERAGKFKPQDCRKSIFTTGNGGDCFSCGDECSLFGEPETETAWNEMKSDQKTGRIFVELCEKTWYFDEFEDER